MPTKKSTSSPYLNQFTQPDSIVPDSNNPQDWNRYSYAHNNPIRYNDPDGHEAKDPCDYYGIEHCMLKSTIRMGFGTENKKGDPTGHGALGTVIYDRRHIVTAAHVFQSMSEFMGYRTGSNGEDLHLININKLTLDYSAGGDQLIITLPEDLPKDFLPTIPKLDHSFSPLQNVSVAYQDENRGLGVFKTNLTRFPNSQYYETPQYLVTNPKGFINKGDSGGGVFYDGQLVGINSYVKQTYHNYGPWLMSFQPFK